MLVEHFIQGCFVSWSCAFRGESFDSFTVLTILSSKEGSFCIDLREVGRGFAFRESRATSNSFRPEREKFTLGPSVKPGLNQIEDLTPAETVTSCRACEDAFGKQKKLQPG